MTLTIQQWLTVGVAIIGVLTQFFIAYLGRRQVKKQLDLQHLVSHRTTATFVADKRQKWIDELRTDMAFHLALSQEIVWKWDAMRDRTALRVREEATDANGVINGKNADRIRQEAADAFSPENGARDREHQERHIRLLFRLNPKEQLHVGLRECLGAIRDVLKKTQSAKSEDDARKFIGETLQLVEQAQKYTEAILKAEWTRVKQEVAYPETLMETIPKPENRK
ncbi:hypothetical protein ACFELC_23660 [Pseudomonas aeruginosa]|uniref:hypothetical protein n=1 Tax=Pseudomonas aeruginosa TaxID=287 RepID=UPI00383B40AD